MKILRRLLLISVFLIGLLSLVTGQNIVLKQSNESGVYKKGQVVRVVLHLKNQGIDSVSILIRKNFVELLRKAKVKFPGDSLMILEESFKEPTTLIFEASAKNETASIGAIIEPNKYKPATKRPEDFDNFWKAEKKGH